MTATSTGATARGATARVAPTSGHATFRPKARLMRTLGEEHISSQKMAIIELVKNAYDADATRVLVRFHGPLELGAGCIEVIDNGHGMSLETIQTTWMEPATIIKKRKTRSEQRNRRVLGEKGIGRFATSRLANQLEIITRRADAKDESRVCLDWRQFDDEKYLDEVQFFWETTEPSEICHAGTIEALWAKDKQKPESSQLSHGTILRMTGLCQRWGKEEVEEIRRGLTSLISPFFAQKQPSVLFVSDEFQIGLELPEPYQHLSGIIGPSEVLRNPHYSAQGSISENGSYQFTITWRETDTPELIRGQFILKDNRRLRCGPFHLELRVWDRDSAAPTAAQKMGSTITNFEGDLNDAAGIRLYRDGFRVWPYGEPGNDWLGLDARHAQNPTLRLAHNQIVGYVLISADKNPQLRDQSNREGLIEGPAYNEWREVIKMALSELESRRYNLRHENEQDTAKAGGRLTEFDLTAISDLIKERYSDDTELLALIEEKEKALKPQVEEAQKVLSRYHRLATLGQLILTLVHDGRTPVTHINHEVFFAKRDIRRAGKEEEPFVQHLEKSFDRIEKEVQVVRQFFKNLAPFGIRFTRRLGRVRLEQIIADAFAMQESEIAKSQVCTHLPQTETWLTVEPTEIQTMIVNFLQNSLYWLSKVPKESRQIMVQVSSAGPEEVQILFSDSGPGVPPSVRDRIFEPYYSTKPDGMGLGLAIVGDMISEYYDGSLELMEGGPLPGATFRITLRKGEQND